MPDHKRFSDVIYLVEVQWHAEFIMESIQEARVIIRTFDPTANNREEEKLKRASANTKVHRHLQSALTSGASIKKLLYPSERKGSDGRSRTERAEHLLKFLNGIELPTIRDSKIRNSLEHYDEFLDDYVKKVSSRELDDTITCYNWIGSDMPLNSRNGNEAVYPLRVFFGDTQKYRNGSLEIDINALYWESVSIIEQLALVTFAGERLHYWRVAGLPTALMKFPLPLTEDKIIERREDRKNSTGSSD